MPTPSEAAVYDLVQELFQARSADNESGAHWLNNLEAEKWAKANPSLVKAMNELSKFVENWGPE